MLPGWAKDTVTIRRAPIVVSRGTKVRDWQSPDVTSHTIERCIAAPVAPQDSHMANTTALIRLKLLAPANADIQRGDRVIYKGTEYSLDGAPVVVMSPFGAVSHMTAYLRDWI